jgi:hypothetical protein
MRSMNQDTSKANYRAFENSLVVDTLLCFYSIEICMQLS